MRYEYLGRTLGMGAVQFGDQAVRGTGAAAGAVASRAAGEQRVKGALDANIPARVDLLFMDIGQPMRLQSVYLPADERREVFSPEAVHAL